MGGVHRGGTSPPSATSETSWQVRAQNSRRVDDAMLAELAELVAAGQLEVPIAGTFALDVGTDTGLIAHSEQEATPDWHFVEEARKKKLEVVRLRPGEGIDADTGAPVSLEESRGLWGLLRASDRPKGRVLKMKGGSVVEVGPDGAERPLPPGELIRAGKALVLPPPGSAQRRFDKVLGHYRLNIGNGYALHGTMATNQLGRSVSHGCVRVADADIERLFKMAKVGDQVLIY